MTALTLLAREMAEEYRSLTGRQITAEEYLKFRKQALRESDRGYAGSLEAAPPREAPPKREGEKQVGPAAKTRPVAQIRPKADEEDPFFALCNKID